MLRGQRVEGVDAGGATLRWACLAHAGLSRSSLAGADLRAADLRFADLSGCDLSHAWLSDADLRWSVLDGANLVGARLGRARLKGAVLTGITVNWTDRTLVSEILWRAAADDTFRRMIAAFIRLEETWCWDRFLAIPSVERVWAMEELRRWVKDGDDAPDVLQSYGVAEGRSAAVEGVFDTNRTAEESRAPVSGPR